MAYFRCATGGGAGATITVTYTSDFYGETITCSHGTKTYTKVATSSGTVEFTVGEEGTWTISCLGFTDTADVDLSYSADLVAVPNGSTVLPTDDIETWLACGQITGKSYTTLSEVLDDAETYERLLSDSNACDYMARSTTWANAGLVPKMTSDSAPSGEAFASSVYSGYPAYRAFDKDASTSWLAGSQSSPSGYIGQYVGYHFTSSVKICRVRIIATRYTEMVVEGSDDNSIYTPIDTITMSGSETATEYTFNINNSESYSYYRVRCSSAPTSNNPNIWELQFYAIADASIVDDADAMMRLGKYDYACDALLADSTWADAIATSTYVSYVLDNVAQVPTMTSNTTPSGEVSTNYKYASREPYQAFDGQVANFGTGAHYWYSTNINQYLEYEFTQDVCVTSVSFYYVNTLGSNAVLKIQASDDNETWTDLITDGITLAPRTVSQGLLLVTRNIDTAKIGKYCRAYVYSIVSGGGGTNGIGLNRVQFNGYYRHTAQTDIIVTAHGGDTVYYMENGSPVTLTTADRDTGIGTVDWSDLPKGAITLYSSTAKNLSDLTADYSKTVYVTEYTTQIYLMPDNALYWFGWESSNLETVSTANGWSNIGNRTYVTPTFNTYDIAFSASSSQNSFVGTVNPITFSKVSMIAKTTALVSSNGLALRVGDNKTTGWSDNGINEYQTTTNTVQKITFNNAKTNCVCGVGGITNRTGNVYALWYE